MTTTSDYYIETIDTGTRPHPRNWELRRRIRFGASGFNRKQRRSIGKLALDRFLAGLPNEDARER